MLFIKDIAEDLTAVPTVTKVTEVGWCFKYGEKEWLEGDVFDDVKKAANDVTEDGDAQTAVGRVDCTTGVSI